MNGLSKNLGIGLAAAGAAYGAYQSLSPQNDGAAQYAREFFLKKETPIDMIPLWETTFIYRGMMHPRKRAHTDYTLPFKNLTQYLADRQDDRSVKARGIFNQITHDLTTGVCDDSFNDQDFSAVKNKIVRNLEEMDLRWAVESLLVSTNGPHDPTPAYPRCDGLKGELYLQKNEHVGTGGFFQNLSFRPPLKALNVTLTDQERYISIEFTKDSGFPHFLLESGFDAAKGKLGTKTFQTDNPLEMKYLFNLIVSNNQFSPPAEVSRLSIQLDTTIRKPKLGYTPEYPDDGTYFMRVGSEKGRKYQSDSDLRSFELNESSISIQYQKDSGFKEYFTACGFDTRKIEEERFQTEDKAEMEKLVRIILTNNTFQSKELIYLRDL